MTPDDQDHRPVAVLGGSGFVGGEVLRLMAERGVPAINIDKADPPPGSMHPFRKADMRDREAIRAALEGCRAVILLAAEWRDDVRPVSLYFDVNVEGTRNVADACAELGVRRCVFTSSVSIYGPTEREVGEDHPPGPFNPYGVSKLQGEEVLTAWAARDPAVSLSIVRPSVIFGPRNRGNVWNLLNHMVHGPFVMIGDGENRKSMVYVGNVAAFILHCLDDPAGVRAYNYADKPDFSMNELVGLVSERLGRPSEPSIRAPKWAAMLGGRAFDALSRVTGRRFSISAERVFKFCANTQYGVDAVRRSGFVPPVRLEDALAETLEVEFGVSRGPPKSR